MPELMNSDAVRRLEGYFDRVDQVLGRRERRASFAVYAMGLLGDGERVGALVEARKSGLARF